MSHIKIAIHQPNFIPWFPFFYKMAMADYFIIMDMVQFEKNGFQNRFKYKDKWITKPIENKTDIICRKKYCSGEKLLDVNMSWIYAIKKTLDIKTKVTFGRNSYFSEYYGESFLPDNPTLRIISLLMDIQDTDRFEFGVKKEKRNIIYITNEEAKHKYLDENLIKSEGIEIEYCKVPRHLRKSTFEIIEEYGIEGAIKQLPKRELCEV